MNNQNTEKNKELKETKVLRDFFVTWKQLFY